MGGKKKAGGKKKKGGDDDGEIDQGELHLMLAAKVASLKARLVLEQERRDNADNNVEEIREQGETMNTNMDDEKVRTREMVTKMTQIYKSMEKTYNEKIQMSEGTVDEQERDKKQLKSDIAELIKEKEDMITRYDSDIFKLRERIDTMSTDFAKMLRTTLTKMQERIDDANQTYEGDQPGGAGDLAAAANMVFNGDDGAPPGGH